jgi:hypothetical protein
MPRRRWRRALVERRSRRWSPASRGRSASPPKACSDRSDRGYLRVRFEWRSPRDIGIDLGGHTGHTWGGRHFRIHLGGGVLLVDTGGSVQVVQSLLYSGRCSRNCWVADRAAKLVHGPNHWKWCPTRRPFLPVRLNFLELRQRELRRISLPRRWVNTPLLGQPTGSASINNGYWGTERRLLGGSRAAHPVQGQR